MELVKDILVYFILGLLFSYPLVWVLNFSVRSRILRKGKILFTLVLSTIIGTWLYHFNFSPNETSTVEVVKMWYPNAKDIKVMSLAKDKTDDDTYQACVSFSFNSFSSCESIITISKAKNRSFFDYSSKGYSCK